MIIRVREQGINQLDAQKRTTKKSAAKEYAKIVKKSEIITLKYRCTNRDFDGAMQSVSEWSRAKRNENKKCCGMWRDDNATLMIQKKVKESAHER